MHAHPASRSGPCARHCVSFALQAALARVVWFVREKISKLLQAKTKKSQLCPASAGVVCAGAPSGGFRRDFCRLVDTAIALATALQGLARAAEARIHRRGDERAGGNETQEQDTH